MGLLMYVRVRVRERVRYCISVLKKHQLRERGGERVTFMCFGKIYCDDMKKKAKVPRSTERN